MIKEIIFDLGNVLEPCNNKAAAKELGFKTIHFRDVNKLKEELTKLEFNSEYSFLHLFVSLLKQCFKNGKLYILASQLEISRWIQ